MATVASNLVLLVEDNPADIDLTRESFAESGTGMLLEVATDGVEAIRYLERRNGYRHAPRPRLIMLDLNLPKLDGREVMKKIKADDDLSLIPIIVISSSAANKDITDCYALGANCYLTKPLDLHAYREMMRTVERFWFEMASLPKLNGDGWERPG